MLLHDVNNLIDVSLKHQLNVDIAICLKYRLCLLMPHKSNLANNNHENGFND